MRQAIVTKYLAPTNHRGARIKATAQAGSITVSWDHALDPERNHELAARMLMTEYGWLDGKTTLVGGHMPDGEYCFVLVGIGFKAQ